MRSIYLDSAFSYTVSMKSLCLIFLFTLSTLAHADQAELLAQGRDHLVAITIQKIKTYCHDLGATTVDFTYICRLQIEADCSHGSTDKKRSACSVLKEVKKLEKKIVASDKNLSQLEHLPLYSTRPIQPPIPLTPPSHSPAPEIKPEISFNQVSVRIGSSKTFLEKDSEGIKEFSKLEDLKIRIEAQKVRVDCQASSDCAVQEYGKKGCGGPMGTFVYSKTSENQSLIKDVNEFNKADAEFSDKWNRNVVDTCQSFARSEPAFCKAGICY